MLAAMHMLAALGEGTRTLSDLAAEFDRYPASGEINSTVTDQHARLGEIERHYTAQAGVTIDKLDGLTLGFPDGSWANLRPSNTEPLLRLNLEGLTPAVMEARRDEVLAFIRA
jgi:phosphomannomutase